MKIALAQINTTVGDLAGNVDRCLAALDAAREQGADLAVLPEMAIPGYPPRDILFDPSFTAAAGEAVRDLAGRASGGPPALVGTLVPGGRATPHHPGLYNGTVLVEGGDARLVAAKRLLPTYDVFFESRWFVPGPALPPVVLGDRTVGVLVCEDLWDEGYFLHPPADLTAAGADLLVTLSASPYRRGVLAQRLRHARRAARPVVYVNAVGAQDELIFDGRSFVADGEGRLLARLPGFESCVRTVDLAGPPGAPPEDDEPVAELYRALVLGVRDFARKNGVKRAFLGLSGGVDSSVVAVLAADALGPAHVTGVAIPSRYTDPRSTSGAEALARALGIGFEVVELAPLHAAAEASLASLLVAGGTVAENVQARLRMVILMAFVNRYGGMLLNTSNKTELAVGYGTLYGDLAGTLSPIGDLTKPDVYALARWIQASRSLMDDFILARPPSAELKPDQVDPFDYPKLAPVLERLVQGHRSNSALRRAEHKRWHMGVVLKVSEKAFGTGRMIPITRR
jgi:NAD+ synthetase